MQAGRPPRHRPSSPEQARAALGAIETTGREALDRDAPAARRAARQDDADDAAARTRRPAWPTSSAWLAQTAGGRRPGRAGDHRASPAAAAGIELSAYRIVQEALTNVVKHADAPASRRRRSRTRSAACPSRSPTTAAAGRSADGTGHGLIGMRERVDLYGGQLQAGPAAGRGFRVARGCRWPMADGVTIRVAGRRRPGPGPRRPARHRRHRRRPRGRRRGRHRPEAVELARRERPDVVLMDIRMPDMDGIEATRLITAATAAYGC